MVIRLKNGKKYENSVLYPKGEPENPIRHEEIKQKVNALIQNNKDGLVKSFINNL